MDDIAIEKTNVVTLPGVTILTENRSPLEELVDNLDRYNVPTKGLSLWDRVEMFAANYEKYLQDANKQSEQFVSESLENKELKLSEDQAVAWGKLQKWMQGTEPFFVLKGFAGTGKTFLLQMLLETSEVTMKFTAPTNKAAKVLSSTLKTSAGTIYSLLGLRMVTKENSLYLEYPKELPRISKKTIVVIDEASMVGSDLYKFILKAQAELKFRVIFVGDPAQLNPVGEVTSPAWKVTKDFDSKAMLREVMRFDNQLLKLSIRIRKRMKEKDYKPPIRDDHSETEGVFVLPEHQFERRLRKLKLKDFSDCKVIAWRNKTVDKYNSMIRKSLGFTEEYEVGEVLLLGDQIELDGAIVAHKDEEGVATKVSRSKLMVDDVKIPVWMINFKTDTQTLRLMIPHKDDDKLADLLQEKASLAGREKNPSRRRTLWKDFWDTKRRFHTVRYGYAMTAHRIQGSTIKHAYVDQSDILVNTDKPEAFRCLYVACTRPTTRLYTY